jgi:transposase
MDGVVEIITGRERRRRWSLQDKARLVAETNEPGALIRAVAARHGVCESLLFTWRRQAREGLLGPAAESPVFVPVQALAPASTALAPLDEGPRPAPAPASRSVGAPGLIEIELGDGRQVRVGSDVNLAALRRVLAALRG